MIYKLKCAFCNKEFETKKSQKKYCSKECGYKKRRIQWGNIKTSNLGTTAIGTIAELRVATDLFIKGYEVYRPLSAHCSGDFMIEKNNKIIKIEVRTGYKSLNGKLSYPLKDVRSSILAVVLYDTGEITYLYYPSLIKAII